MGMLFTKARGGKLWDSGRRRALQVRECSPNECYSNILVVYLCHKVCVCVCAKNVVVCDVNRNLRIFRLCCCHTLGGVIRDGVVLKEQHHQLDNTEKNSCLEYFEIF